MVANGPRYSAGAFGLGSKVSRWLGPPPSHSNRMDWAFGVPAEDVLASRSGTLEAKGTVRAARTKARRLIPWQSRAGKLPIRNMAPAPASPPSSLKLLKCIEPDGREQGARPVRRVGNGVGLLQPERV